MWDDVAVVTVFAAGPGGGNPAPVVLDAAGMSDVDMRRAAMRFGHECSFVLPAGPGCDLALRFWVPEHEVTMCGHATVGTVWLLACLGLLPTDTVTVRTRSGLVVARLTEPVADGSRAEVSQPKGRVDAVHDTAEVPAALGLTEAELAPLPLGNATTSRTKTIVPVADADRLHALTPDFDRVAAACEHVGSTGLYPYAVTGRNTVVARQFPRASGYPEDAATGVAAAALACALRDAGVVAACAPVVVGQGQAMGRPSEITVTSREDGGCWLGGRVARAAPGGPS